MDELNVLRSLYLMKRDGENDENALNRPPKSWTASCAASQITVYLIRFTKSLPAESLEDRYMKISIEEKKAEAIARMSILGINSEAIHQFEEDGIVHISEPPRGIFYRVEGMGLERIRQFEKAYNAMVYVAVRSYTIIGMMDCYLFVGDHIEEWEMDRIGLLVPRDGVFAYVYNHDAPVCSELGDIGVERTAAAGLKRIW